MQQEGKRARGKKAKWKQAAGNGQEGNAGDRRGLLVVLALAAVAGCATRGPDPSPIYRTVAADPRRDSPRAEAENRRGKALLDEDRPAEAEEAFKAALAADVFCGPAHSNLGAAYLAQGKLYLAAWEFQYAARLMPGRPEPRKNLGLVFETVGRLDEAGEQYRQAMEASPDSPEVIGNLARCRVRAGLADERTRDLLEQVMFKDTRPEWLEWARVELKKLPPTDEAPKGKLPPAPTGQPPPSGAASP